jgi:hypothetical protein
MNSNNQNPGKDQDRPNEIPEKRESEQEKSGYPHETDVTPPDHKEFPSVGNPETDFRPSNHGRTTGRMVGHEPGTEGGI